MKAWPWSAACVYGATALSFPARIKSCGASTRAHALSSYATRAKSGTDGAREVFAKLSQMGERLQPLAGTWPIQQPPPTPGAVHCQISQLGSSQQADAHDAASVADGAAARPLHC